MKGGIAGGHDFSAACRRRRPWAELLALVEFSKSEGWGQELVNKVAILPVSGAVPEGVRLPRERGFLSVLRTFCETCGDGFGRMCSADFVLGHSEFS